MEAVIKTMREAESACMKVYSYSQLVSQLVNAYSKLVCLQRLTPLDDPEESEAVALGLNWKKNLYYYCNMESVRAPLGKK